MDPQQVGCRIIQLPQGFLFPQTVLGDPCRFLKDGPSVFRTAVEDLVDLILADDGQGSPPQPCIRQKGHYILQPAVFLVDGIFAVPTPVHPALETYFLEIHRQAVVRIVEHQGYFRHPHRPAAAASGKNHILHLRAPEVFDALFPQDPADGIGNIALAAAVGPHNGSDARFEFDIHFVCKGFKPMG